MEKPYVVGIDIGGTNTVFGIVDTRGNILSNGSVKTQAYLNVEDYAVVDVRDAWKPTALQRESPEQPESF